MRAPLARHLARGAAGFAALTGTFVLGPTHPWLALLLIPTALLAFRGCPTCWLLGFGAACAVPPRK